jgi:16S rRNA (adenine1518-N6/adenine1519-N6)-dimethyltransferase
VSQSLREKIVERMKLLGVQPKRSLGQNFLVSDHVVDRIMEAAQPESFQFTYEIGPGLGALTDGLKVQSQKLKVIELDRIFSDYWREQGLEVIEKDALKFDWPAENLNDKDHLLVSNLPYQISSRLVVDLSILYPSFSRMVLMFQKEVAQRMVAPAGDEHYGLISVVAQLHWHIQQVVEAGSVDFMPKPQVASRVLCFNRKDTDPSLSNPSDFLAFVKKAFANRRKKLLPRLLSYGTREELETEFESLKISPDIRIEKLEPEQILELYLKLKKE